MAAHDSVMSVQVCGDSFARRLATYIDSKVGSIDLKCSNAVSLSGSTVREFKVFLKANPLMVFPGVTMVLCLGVNDILRNTPMRTLKEGFLAILRLFRRRYPTVSVYVLAIPLLPRLLRNQVAIEATIKFNKFLLTLQTSSTRVVDLSVLNGRKKYFEAVYRDGRPDLIHLNDLGHSLLVRKLLGDLLPAEP